MQVGRCPVLVLGGRAEPKRSVGRHEPRKLWIQSVTEPGSSVAWFRPGSLPGMPRRTES